MSQNPFHELYVTEYFGPDAFIRLFSDKLVNHTLALFKPGNIILEGLPGTGKTMMLNLLKPSIRIAYKRNKVKFPIPDQYSDFIGAGINLIRSTISDFGQRPLSESGVDNLNELAIYFGDFLNYSLVKDILDSIIALNDDLSNELNINLNSINKEKFIRELQEDEAWFGYLNDIDNFDQLYDKIKKRIITYRSFLNYNIDRIPDDISITKTSIGMPIISIANGLKSSGIVNQSTNIFIRIDQYEELAWLDKSINGLGTVYQSVIHKLLAIRDNSVSYRIGTRPFAWKEDNQEIFGTSANLESNRNYASISIDDVLRRRENARAYIFPKFAEDILRKRLIENGYLLDSKNSNSIDIIFGPSIENEEKASKYIKNAKERIIELDDEWPERWNQFLVELAQHNPLSAKLAEAWARQNGKNSIVNKEIISEPFPWEEKVYWKKERIQQALIQIASRNRQQLIWEGRKDILNLSSGNILAFLSICQHIWDVWMRDPNSKHFDIQFEKIDDAIQTLGILEASLKWYDNIGSQRGGKNRKSFINALGSKFYKKLTEDIKMSYPGHNGFSVKLSELESCPEINSFLKEASDYGDLQILPHTTKLSEGEKRVKCYLNPMLSPIFKIPAIHTKEPLYISIEELDSWLMEAKVFDSSRIVTSEIKGNTSKITKKRVDPNQSSLF